MKCHPMFPLARFLNATDHLPAWMRVSEQPLVELANTAEVFLYAAPSTTAWEAYLMGLPVLRYTDGAFQMDAIDALGSAAVRSCSWQTLREEMVALLNTRCQEAPDMENRREALEKVFSPVDEAAWLTLVRTP